MKIETTKPFYFPTTVTFVDDSAAFLSNVSLQLDSHLAFRFFNSPERALKSLNEAPYTEIENETLFTRYRERNEESHAQHVVSMSLKAIQRKVHDKRRFELPSVVVVDYDMPSMNGLELCRRLTSRSIKKIILTGKADEHLAVQSFNEGLIDRFIRKQDNQAIFTLTQAISDLQIAYLSEVCRPVSDALDIPEYSFLFDSSFSANVKKIFCSLGIVEHYLSYEPNGLLMLDSSGMAYLLIVHTEETLRSVKEIATEQGAPTDFLVELDLHRKLPYFWEGEAYCPTQRSEWEDHMHFASTSRGQRLYIYSVIKNPPGFALGGIFPYGRYLERLDQALETSWGLRS